MKSEKKINIKKRIAVVAHDSYKADLINWIYLHKGVLVQHDLISTKRTGDILEATSNHPVQKLSHGFSGGFAQLRSMILEGNIDMILFFWPTEEDTENRSIIISLQRTAVNSNIITAFNPATADFVITSLLMDKEHLGSTAGINVI